MQSSNAACPQIRFHDCAGNRLRHGEQSPRRFRRSGGCGCRLVLWPARDRVRAVAGSESVGLRRQRRGNRRGRRSRGLRRAGRRVRRLLHPSICRLRPCQFQDLSGARTSSVRACSSRRRPASSGLHGDRSRDSGGTPPRPRARDGAPVRVHIRAWSCRPLGDARDRISLQNLGEDADAASIIGRRFQMVAYRPATIWSRSRL